jgi:DNA-binding transcriptional MerR regulator
LILQPERKPSGYRLYPEEAKDQVHFIRQAKDLGFSLKEIRELLDLRLDGEQACDEVRSLAEAKIADIEERSPAAEERTTLEEQVVRLQSHKKNRTCPILRQFEKGGPTMNPRPTRN